MDIRKHNRDAWNQQVEKGNRWTIPVGDKEIEAARQGDCRIVLTPNKPIPETWLMPLKGRRVLCLASGGGQQGPVLAAAGAVVTLYDNSPRQLDQDRMVAEKYGLNLETVEGDMRDLSAFENKSFDLVVHPVSNTFVPNIQPVWDEAFRILRNGGELISGFTNTFIYLFNEDAYDHGRLEVSHSIPYSDLDYMDTDEGVKHRIDQGGPLEFSHTLETQIGGQIEAGFLIIGFYEDRDRPEENDLLSKYTDKYIATRARKVL